MSPFWEGSLLIVTLLAIGFLLMGKRKNKKNDFARKEVHHAEAEITEMLDEDVSGGNAA